MTLGAGRLVLVGALFISAAILLWYNLLDLSYTVFNTTQYTFIPKNDMIYILIWTTKNQPPLDALMSESKAFENCPHKNCFVTNNRNYFDSITNFSALIFNERELASMKPADLPKERSPEQIYIFGATESSHYYPLCGKYFEGMFNWTYTYKIDSDLRWGYITIYDMNGTVVGPRIDMKWTSPMKPVDEALKLKLKSKSKAAAWFVTNCRSLSGREKYVKQLQNYTRQYGLTVDIYGPCGTLRCPKNQKDVCFRKIEKDYYFYLAFENSFAEDYVTEKLLNALNHDAVPIVFGGANYSRFLPPGSFLDARAQPPAALAATMRDLIADRARYVRHFAWRSHYRYRETTYGDDVCRVCAALGGRRATGGRRTVRGLRRWFNGEHGRRCPHDDYS